LNSLKDINQFIIIADAPGNTEEETKAKRAGYHGESYWSKHSFPITFYD